VEIAEIILHNIAQLEEQFIIVRSYIQIYSTLQKFALFDDTKKVCNSLGLQVQSDGARESSPQG
jgi:N-acetylglutamate synthase-like GNAT family acetyltransferase